MIDVSRKLYEAQVVRVRGSDIWVRLRKENGVLQRDVTGPCNWQRSITGVEATLTDPGPPHFFSSGQTSTDSSHSHTYGILLRRDDPSPGTKCIVAIPEGHLRPWVVAFVN